MAGTPTTTYPTIRDQWIEVIEALTPAYRSQPFALYTEHQGDFREWAEENGPASLRRFMVRRAGDRARPAVTDNQKVQLRAEAELVIAYPKGWSNYSRSSSRREVIDLEDVIEQDAEQIAASIGIAGAGNYVSGQSWCAAEWSTEDGENVIFLVMTLEVIFTRAIGDAVQVGASQVFTVVTTTTSDVQPIAIPYAMPDASYNVVSIVPEDITYLGVSIELKPGTRTANSFDAQCSTTIPSGITLAVTLEDRS